MQASNSATQAPLAGSTPMNRIFDAANRAAEDVKKGEWHGRRVYESKKTFKLAVWAIISAIFVVVGAALLSAHPIIGSLILVRAAIGLATNVRGLWKPNELKVALSVLTERALDGLPEMPKSKWSDGNRIKQFSREDISGALRLSQWVDMMALKDEGKTVAVAIKYFNPEYQWGNEPSFSAHVIKVFSIENKFETFVSPATKNNPTEFHVTDKLWGRDANAIEAALKRP
jgi:hypothetical protein